VPLRGIRFLRLSLRIEGEAISHINNLGTGSAIAYVKEIATLSADWRIARNDQQRGFFKNNNI